MKTYLAQFGLREFRPLQERIIRQVLDGKNTLAILPTGAGKSLTCQLPALMLPGVSLVISPLIALMRDQQESLVAKGIPARRLDASFEPEQREKIWQEVESGKIKLLYLAPESFHLDKNFSRLMQLKIGLVTVDEAHCLSEWGPKFRPDYRQLPSSLAKLGAHAILLLTATATPKVAEDLRNLFSISLENQIRLSVAKPNIRREVEFCENKPERIAEIFAEKSNLPAIVYVPTRKDTQNLAAALSEFGIPAKAYHAGFDANVRAEIQEEFRSGKCQLLVATIAFGMGIDQSNIRSVVHAGLPASPEAYIQESGRAGRDLAPARSIVLISAYDKIGMETRALATLPTRENISNWLFSVFRNAPNLVRISSYATAQSFDLTPSVLDQFLLSLIEKNLLVECGDSFGKVKVKPLRAVRFFLHEGQPDFEKLQWLASKGAKPMEIEEISLAWNESREWVFSFLNELLASGNWGVEFSFKLKEFQTRQVESGELKKLSEEFYSSLVNLLLSDVSRIEQIQQMLTSRQVCLDESLALYFGDEVPTKTCGNCFFCLKKSDVAPEVHFPDPSDEQFEELKQLKAKRLSSLSSPQRMARFLAGIYSTGLPLSLTRHSLYGAFKNYPWKTLLAYAM